MSVREAKDKKGETREKTRTTDRKIKIVNCLVSRTSDYYEGLRSQTMVWLRKLKFVEMRMCRQ